MPEACAVDGFPHGFVERAVLASGVEEAWTLSEYFVKFIASDARTGGIDGDDAVVSISDKHAFGSVLIDQRSKASLFLEPLALSDVSTDADEADDTTFVVEIRRAQHF